MKIALVSPYSWTTPGGVNAHIDGLAAHLRTLGHEVRILAPADGEVAGIIPLGRTLGVPYNGSVARMTFGPRVAGRVRVALRRAQPDVVHVHEPFAPSASMLTVLASRVPVVATFHASAESRAYRAAKPALAPLWRKLAVKIAVSQAARDTVEGVFGPGVRIIPNGIDTERFAGVEATPQAMTVLFFGRLEARKGAMVLARALPALFARVPDARVVFAGDGPQREELEAAIPADRRAHVTIMGRFEESARLGLMGSASIACFPATGGESFGITLVEAMAAGLPVVASAIPGYAGVARDGKDAVLVPPDDADVLGKALAALLRDGERQAELARVGRARAATFDWSHISEEIVSAYREAIAAGAGGRRARRGSAEPL